MRPAPAHPAIEVAATTWAMNLLVLRVLGAGPNDGYGICRTIREVTDDALDLEEGALYPALYRMERREWIAATWREDPGGRRARVYGLTAAGRNRLETEIAGWRTLSSAIRRVVEMP